MADEKKFADEMLTDDELDKVAGGTLDELKDLQKLFYHYTTTVYKRGEVTVYKSADWIKDWLKSRLNIDAEINYRNSWFFTSAGANSYSRNGEILTHEQVIEEIKAKRGN